MLSALMLIIWQILTAFDSWPLFSGCSFVSFFLSSKGTKNVCHHAVLGTRFLYLFRHA